jgi:hypothetical protein
MIRDTLDSASTYAFMFPTPDGRRAFQHRTTIGGSAKTAGSIGVIYIDDIGFGHPPPSE